MKPAETQEQLSKDLIDIVEQCNSIQSKLLDKYCEDENDSVYEKIKAIPSKLNLTNNSIDTHLNVMFLCFQSVFIHMQIFHCFPK